MVVDEQDVDAWFDVAMLEGVVEQDDVQLLVIGGELLDASGSLLVDGHGDVGEFAEHLVGLVAYVRGLHALFGLEDPPGLALVAPAEHGHAELVFQQTGQILHVRCLSRSADSNVAYRYDRHRESPALEYAHLEAEVSQPHGHTVEPAQGRQRFVDSYKVAFHICVELSSVGAEDATALPARRRTAIGTESQTAGGPAGGCGSCRVAVP